MNLSALNISPQKEKQFNKKGIFSVEDLIHFLPRKYNDFTRETGIRPENEVSCITIKLNQVKQSYGKVDVLMAFGNVLSDGSKIMITWFHQSYRRREISGYIGREVYVAGKVTYDDVYKTYKISSPELFELKEGLDKKVIPIYSKIAGMSDEYLKDKIIRALDLGDSKKETLPGHILDRLNLCSTYDTAKYLHIPTSMEEVEKGKRRVLYDELITYAVKSIWAERNSAVGSPFTIKTVRLVKQLAEGLPFELTEDQKNAVNEMIKKVRSGKRLNALVQGDVGCGKTIIAFFMMAAFAGSGYQSVLMAPTQVLARQHYNDLNKMLKDTGYEVVYLGSELKAAEKREANKKIESGKALFIVGTHSVIGKSVNYKNLACVITDEEHKFGVIQRNALVEKASTGVHQITMSATPIPRTLAQVIYGNNIDLYTIKTMPNGRLPVITGISKGRDKVYRFILSQIKKGHQIYIVCPMIEHNDEMKDVKSVEEISVEYSNALSPYGIQIATLTGKNTKEELEDIITSFKNGDIKVLIATTVIEVGVNVPNATTIVITNAERFGLSQLHQLRGRVGRGSFQSYCILESEDIESERLSAMVKTTSGFEIAKEDLIIRGAGDFLGTKQYGDNKYLTLMLAYPEEYKAAQRAAKEIIDAAEPCILLKNALGSDIENFTI